MRRTVSIDDKLFTMIQKFRGQMLSNEQPYDLSVTEAINFFIAQGLADFYDMEPDKKSALVKETLEQGLDREAVIDDYMEKTSIKDVPKIIDELEEFKVEVEDD